MKITKVNFVEGEARILMGGFATTTFCIPLKDKTTKQEVIDELTAMIKKKQPDTTEQTFNDLDLKSLEGTDI